MRGFESGLRPIVEEQRDEETQSKSAPIRVGQQRPPALAIRGEEQTEHQKEADQPKVEIGFKIPIVGFISMPAECIPKPFKAIPEPETFKPSPQHRIDVFLEQPPPK